MERISPLNPADSPPSSGGSSPLFGSERCLMSGRDGGQAGGEKADHAGGCILCGKKGA